MFGIKKIKKRLDFIENELKYQKELKERKKLNKKMKKGCKIPVVNKNYLGKLTTK